MEDSLTYGWQRTVVSLVVVGSRVELLDSAVGEPVSFAWQCLLPFLC